MTLRLDAVDLSAFEPASAADWRDAVAKVLKGQPFDTLRTVTADGTIEPLYARAVDGLPITPARGNAPWGIVSRVDHPDVVAANAQALADLEGGSTGLDLVFASSPHARGFGLADDADIARILEGVMADLVAIRVSGGLTTIARALDVVAASGVAADRLAIALAYDPIAESVRAGGSDVPLADRVSRAAVEAAAFAARFGSSTLLIVDGRIWHEAGASRIETLGCQLAAAVTYWRALVAAGLSVEEAASRIGFVSAIDHGQFSSIAELRALRLLWARATEAAALPPQRAAIHAETSFRMLSRRDSNTNMIRNTVAAFAAGVGGVDSLTVLPHSSANGLPDTLSRRIARNTHLILQEESNLHRVVDPGAGSGRVETETRQLAEAAWSLFQSIETAGGIIAALETGELQARIEATADARTAEIRAGKWPITGASIYPPDRETAAAVLDLPPIEPSQGAIGYPLIALPGRRLAEPFEQPPVALIDGTAG